MKKVVILGCENSHADTFLNFIKEAGGKFIKKFNFLIEYVANEKNQFYKCKGACIQIILLKTN